MLQGGQAGGRRRAHLTRRRGHVGGREEACASCCGAGLAGTAAAAGGRTRAHRREEPGGGRRLRGACCASGGHAAGLPVLLILHLLALAPIAGIICAPLALAVPSWRRLLRRGQAWRHRRRRRDRRKRAAELRGRGWRRKVQRLGGRGAADLAQQAAAHHCAAPAARCGAAAAEAAAALQARQAAHVLAAGAGAAVGARGGGEFKHHAVRPGPLPPCPHCQHPPGAHPVRLGRPCASAAPRLVCPAPRSLSRLLLPLRFIEAIAITLLCRKSGETAPAATHQHSPFRAPRSTLPCGLCLPAAQITFCGDHSCRSA